MYQGFSLKTFYVLTDTLKQYFIKCEFSLPLWSSWEPHSSGL